MYIFIYFRDLTSIIYIGLVGRVFATGPGDLRSIPGHIIPKTLRMVLDASLLSTPQYKVLSRVN